MSPCLCLDGVAINGAASCDKVTSGARQVALSPSVALSRCAEEWSAVVAEESPAGGEHNKQYCLQSSVPSVVRIW